MSLSYLLRQSSSKAALKAGFSALCIYAETLLLSELPS